MRLIDLDAVLLIIEEIKVNKNIPKNYGTLLDIMRKIRQLPTIDVEPVVHGHWVTERAISVFPICSNCNTVNACRSPYCGGCGAKMDEEQ